MVVTIRTINSEVEIRKDFHRNFKFDRELDQNAFYLGDGSKFFYNLDKDRRKKINYETKDNENYEILKKNFLKKGETLAFVSLGCGDGKHELEMLNRAVAEGYDIAYFGVDSSMSMLNLTRENFQNCKFPVNLICGDFTSDIFHFELRNILKGYSKCLFLFLGNTLANVPQNYIADILRNMLKSDEYLWLDVFSSESTQKNSGELFERYMKYLENEEYKKFFFNPLIDLNVPVEKGELIVEMRNERSLKSIYFQFQFLVKEKIEFEMEGDIITLLPDDVINLIYTRVYDAEVLIKFFSSRDFKLFERKGTADSSQLLFKKE